MESKFYFLQGQNVDNTKISDRSHALHIKEHLWKKVISHLDRKRLIQEAIDKEIAHKKALKDGSDAMTRTWEDSLQNIQEKKEKTRKAEQNQTSDEYKIEEFYKIKKEQDKIRREYVEKIKKKIFVSRGYPKELTSALLSAEITYERDNQCIFNKKLREEREYYEKLEGNEYQDNARKGVEEEIEENLNRLKINLEYGQNLKDQIKSNKELKYKQQKEELDEENRNNIKANEEMKALEKYENNNKLKNKQQMKMDKKKELDDELHRKQLEAEESQELDDVIDICLKAKERIECLRRTKEVELRNNNIKTRDAVCKKVAALIQKSKELKERKEEESFQKQLKEKEEIEQKQNEEKQKFIAQIKQDRILQQQQYMEKMERKQKELAEIKRWETLNRYKIHDAIQHHQKELKLKRWNELAQYRQELIDQITRNEEIRKEEKRIEKLLSEISLAEEDKMFFNYAHEVIKLAMVKNRSTYPIERVIQRYRKENNIK